MHAIFFLLFLIFSFYQFQLPARFWKVRATEPFSYKFGKNIDEYKEEMSQILSF